MTVSRVLRGEPVVSAATRNRVLRIARELGWRPNPLVRALMAQRRAGARRVKPMRIAYLTSFQPRDAWRSHESFKLYFEGARKRAEQLGYGLEEFASGTLKDRAIGNALQEQGFVGLIVGPRPTPMGTLDLDWSSFAVAALGLSLAEPRLHRVSPDYYDAMFMGLEQVRRRGYQRPGLILPAETNARFIHLFQAAIDVDAERHVPALIMERPERTIVADWYRKFRPDVVLGVNRQTPEWLRAAGARVPAVGYAHFNWQEPLGTFAGVDLCAKLVGAAAVDLVAEQLTTNERGVPAWPKHVQLPVRWKDGSSVHAEAKRRSA